MPSTESDPEYRIVDRPRVITFVGGGLWTPGKLHQGYWDAVGRYLGELDQDPWQDWWRASGQPECDIWSWVAGKTDRRIRRTAKKVKAEVFRSFRAIQDVKSDPEAVAKLAREDIEGLLGALVSRFGLQPWPDLPDAFTRESMPRTYFSPPAVAPPTRQRRRNMASVDVYPSSHRRRSDEWTFAARCSPIYELYTLALKAGAPIKATCSWMRIVVESDWPAELQNVVDGEPADGFGFSEHQRCAPDRTILAAPRDHWAQLYLDWLHGRMLLTARARGWDEAPLEAARQWCLNQDLSLELVSKPKSSPDRRFRAMLQLRIDQDGMRHVTLMVTTRDHQPVSTVTKVFTPFLVSVNQFKAMSRHLRWTSPSTVSADDRWRVADLPWNPGICSIELELAVAGTGAVETQH